MRILLPLLCLVTSISSAKTTPASNLSGTWKSVRYLDWGIHEGKVSQAGPFELSADHFAYFYFNPQQTLTLAIDGEVPEETSEGREANAVLKVSVFKGTLRADRPLLDEQCKKVPYLTTHFACGYKPGIAVPLKFTVSDFNGPSFQEKRSLIADRFSKNGITDIEATVTTSNLDGSSGGAMVMFIGKNHLVLQVDYYKNKVGPDAFGKACSKKNGCTSTGLLFTRVP